LVTFDMLGMFHKFHPAFARKYLDLATVIDKALKDYIDDVKTGDFPSADESFSI
jgi:3-methyl-2-oxobutanoate hydroxymethyltransferase